MLDIKDFKKKYDAQKVIASESIIKSKPRDEEKEEILSYDDIDDFSIIDDD